MTAAFHVLTALEQKVAHLPDDAIVVLDAKDARALVSYIHDLEAECRHSGWGTRG